MKHSKNTGISLGENIQKIPHVELELVRKDWYKNHLKNLVTKDFLDFAVICHIKNGLLRLDVTQFNLGLWNVDEETFWRIVMEQHQKEEFVIKSIRMIVQDKMDEEPVLFEGIEDVYVLTHERIQNGASAMMRKDLLKEHAEGMGANLWILPSSKHEVILVADRGIFGAVEYKEIVRNANKELLDVTEVLSDNVYYYDREKDEIQLREE